MASSSPRLFAGGPLLTVLAVLYLAGAVWAARNIIVHTQGSTKAIEQVLSTYNMKNEGEKTLESYSREHPFLSLFFSSPVKKALSLPSQAKADDALTSGVAELLRKVRQESFVAAWWSWGLLSFSLLYLVTVIGLQRRLTNRGVIFSLTLISVVFFAIGIFAPAMVIWTAPVIPMETGNLSFVVQHQVRGIAAIIWELLKAGHYVIGGFLLLFSIVTPLVKASLTFFITGSRSQKRNAWIGELLHTIGKWSMADVFVAAILLALYALKFQEATKSIPCLGLYYFIGYCLLALSTTELLVHSGAVSGDEGQKSRRTLDAGFILGLAAALICFAALSGLYTYQQYTENTKKAVNPSMSPDKLNNADLVLPVHK
jgi:hypothetical protein